MENKYLTKKRKELYMYDFHNLLNVKKKFWKIDTSDLKNRLIKINKNSHIQTLYSKYINISELTDNLSYLKFCYTQKVELKLFREIIPYFICEYNYEQSYIHSFCNYKFHYPKKNENFIEGSSNLGLNCTDDKDYFNINHLSLNLETENIKIHKKFWNDLSSKLAKLNP